MDGQVFLEADVVTYIRAYTEGLWEWSRWHFFGISPVCFLVVRTGYKNAFLVLSNRKEGLLAARILVVSPI